MPTLSKAKVLSLLKPKAILKPKAKDTTTWLTFYDPGHSINELREMHPDLFFSKPGEGWYKDEALANLKENPTTRKMSLGIVEGSLNKTFAEQKAMLPKGQAVPNCRQVVMMFVLHFLATGEKLFTEHWARTSDQTPHGDLVGVRCGPDGLRVAGWDGNAFSADGVPSVWTS